MARVTRVADSCEQHSYTLDNTRAMVMCVTVMVDMIRLLWHINYMNVVARDPPVTGKLGWRLPLDTTQQLLCGRGNRIMTRSAFYR